MRRTSVIRLTLLSAASLGMAGCGLAGQDGGLLFTGEDACIKSFGAGAADDCRESFRIATLEHRVTAPRFPDPGACQAATGTACIMAELKPDQEPYAQPVMAGVVVGPPSPGVSRAVLPVYGGIPGCQPEGPDQPPCEVSIIRGSGGLSSWYYAGRAVGTSSGAGDVRSLHTSWHGATMLGRSGSVSRGGLGSAGRFHSAGG